MENRIRRILMIGSLLLLVITFAAVILDGPQVAKADKKPQYKVVKCSEQGLEKALNDMTSKGWEFVQSEMAMNVLIFKK